jgi:hypothetical protein
VSFRIQTGENKAKKKKNKKTVKKGSEQRSRGEGRSRVSRAAKTHD